MDVQDEIGRLSGDLVLQPDCERKADHVDGGDGAGRAAAPAAT
jgi:hypothetical protein